MRYSECLQRSIGLPTREKTLDTRQPTRAGNPTRDKIRDKTKPLRAFQRQKIKRQSKYVQHPQFPFTAFQPIDILRANNDPSKSNVVRTSKTTEHANSYLFVTTKGEKSNRR